MKLPLYYSKTCACGSPMTRAAKTCYGCRKVNNAKLKIATFHTDYVEVPLNGGHVLTLDYCDYPLVEGRNWYIHNDGTSTRKVVHCFQKGNRVTRIHLYKLMKSLDSTQCLRFIDGNPFNFRRANLKVVSRSQIAQEAAARVVEPKVWSPQYAVE